MKKTSNWLQTFRDYDSDGDSAGSIHEKSKFHEKMPAKTVSITGGKGGVGKTSLSLKIARELSATGYRVLLIDCDYNMSNTAIKLGIPLQENLGSLLRSEKTFDQCLFKDKNFHLLSACNGDVRLTNSPIPKEQLVIDIITGHSSEYDYILLDCPAGLSTESLIISAYCDYRIVVVTPDKSSITDSYSLMKVLSKTYEVKENHLLLNMISSEGQMKRVLKTLSETVESYLGGRLHFLGGIKKLSVTQDRFDSEFIYGKVFAEGTSFSQLVKGFTEKANVPHRNAVYPNGAYMGVRNLEQEFIN